MPTFHWLYLALLIGVLLLLMASRRSERRESEPEPTTQIACSVCGEAFDPEATVEREFTSGYRHFLCGGCVARLHEEASRRELIPDEDRDS